MPCLAWHLYTSYKFSSFERVSKGERKKEKQQENNFSLLNNWPPDFKVGNLGSGLDV